MDHTQVSDAWLPLQHASVDVVVSGLVSNFVADPRAALAEMARVVGGGGTSAACVWDRADKMGLMRFFRDAAVERDAGAAAMDEGAHVPLRRAEALTR